MARRHSCVRLRSPAYSLPTPPLTCAPAALCPPSLPHPTRAPLTGTYPSQLDDDSPNVIRTGGRFLPTTAWECVWHGVASWFGVEEAQMDDVLPNARNFEQSGCLLSGGDLFKES